MLDENALKFSIEQQHVSGAFYNNSRKGIIIYTEDSDTQHEFYMKFYERLLYNSDVKIEKVIHLGSCDDVQQACQRDTDISFPKLYVIDGDIYLQYAPKKSQGRLCVLDRYCIENYLVDEGTLCEVIHRFKSTSSIEEIKQKLSYTSILQGFAQCFVNIYYYCSILSEENKKIKQSKTACFKKPKGWNSYYDASLNCCIKTNFDNFVGEARSELIKLPNIDDSYIDHKLKERQTNFPCCIDTLKKIVSAKDLILPFLMAQTTNKFQVSPSLDDWKINSAELYDPAPLNFLKEKIVTIYNEWNESQVTM